MKIKLTQFNVVEEDHENERALLIAFTTEDGTRFRNAVPISWSAEPYEMMDCLEDMMNWIHHTFYKGEYV